MRTLIEIPETQITALKSVCEAQGLSRAEAIRRAIAIYLDQHLPKEVNGFGLWKNSDSQTEDGLRYQKRLREEW